jgi:hypothetical protein
VAENCCVSPAVTVAEVGLIEMATVGLVGLVGSFAGEPAEPQAASPIVANTTPARLTAAQAETVCWIERATTRSEIRGRCAEIICKNLAQQAKPLKYERLLAERTDLAQCVALSP